MIAPVLTSLLSALNTPVYPDRMPQDGAHPCIVMFVVSGMRVSHTRGPSGLARLRVQVDCRARTKAAAKTLADSVRQALDGFPVKTSANPVVLGVKVQGVHLENERDVCDAPEFGDDMPVFMTQLDFMCWFEETP